MFARPWNGREGAVEDENVNDDETGNVDGGDANDRGCHKSLYTFWYGGDFVSYVDKRRQAKAGDEEHADDAEETGNADADEK